MNCGDEYLRPFIQFMVAFNISKYSIILLRKFRRGIESQHYLKTNYPNLNWGEYSHTEEFKKFMKDIDEDLGKAEVKLGYLYENCQLNMK